MDQLAGLLEDISNGYTGPDVDGPISEWLQRHDAEVLAAAAERCRQRADEIEAGSPYTAGPWRQVADWLEEAGRGADDPYEPVCDTCHGDGIVLVYTGRAGQQRQPCPDCAMEGKAR